MTLPISKISCLDFFCKIFGRNSQVYICTPLWRPLPIKKTTHPIRSYFGAFMRSPSFCLLDPFTPQIWRICPYSGHSVGAVPLVSSLGLFFRPCFISTWCSSLNSWRSSSKVRPFWCP